LSVNHVVKV
jgi:hypothetical protein